MLTIRVTIQQKVRVDRRKNSRLGALDGAHAAQFCIFQLHLSREGIHLLLFCRHQAAHRGDLATQAVDFPIATEFLVLAATTASEHRNLQHGGSEALARWQYDRAGTKQKKNLILQSVKLSIQVKVHSILLAVLLVSMQ